MSSWAEKCVCAVALAVAGLAAQAQPYPGIGRAATPAEVQAWDIDVRPDFKGLPAGAGSVARGQDVWEEKCAGCHGVFGESNAIFNPLAGGTTADDIKTGKVASLRRTDYPGRTTLMKVSQVSTLWDYINRAMPWNQPKSLSVEEVYAVTAYLLHLGDIVPADFTLSDRNIRDVQQRLPNRNGKTTAHAMWPGREMGGTAAPDVAGTACMKDCAVPVRVVSLLPDFARNAHGNLAEQNRTVGAQHGQDTAARPVEKTAATAPAPAPARPADGIDSKAVQALLQKNSCTACHAPVNKLVGPSWADVAKKHAGKTDYLAGKIKAGGSGVWGLIPMPAQAALSDADAKRIGAWLAAGAAP
ncbi:MAG: c-type cytochrome [Ramlibacter sp.]